MTITMAASYDAYDPCADDTVHWLQPRSAVQFRLGNNAPKSKTFLRATASLSLGALLTFGTASTAIAPAAAHTSDVADIVSETGSIDIALPTDLGSLDLAAATDLLPEAEIAIAFPPAVDTPTMIGTVDPDVEASLPAIDIVAAAPIAVSAVELEPSAAASSTLDGAQTAQVAQASPETAPGLGTSLDNFVVDHRPPPDLSEILDFDGMRVPRWIVDTILRAADVTGVDPVYLMALADKESSFLPSNKASTSSAQGLFQFVNNTWLDVVRRFGAKYGHAEEAAAIEMIDGQLTIVDEQVREQVLALRCDPYLSALMAAEMMKRDRAKIERRIGRPISRSEFYLAHFFGVDSASKFMSLVDGKPKQSAPRVFPAAARANKALFFAKQGRKTRQLSVSEVYDKLDEMIDRRLDRYEDVATVATADASL